VVRVRGDVSSQFLTGLLMALPLRGIETTVEVVGELISRPYIDITLASMARFGVEVLRDGWRRFTVPAGSAYRSPGVVQVEGDASSASYFLALGAIGGGPLRVEGIGPDSIQGDVRFADALSAMGAQITTGAQLDRGISAAGRQAARHRSRLQSHSRRGDDAGHHRPVCRRADHLAPHRQLASQGNRPHRRDGGRTAQARCGRRRRRGLSSASIRQPAVCRRRDRYL
jgi:hypothetical protein